MTAILINAGTTHQEKKGEPFCMEVLTRCLIILCTALAIVLSSTAVCDGKWLIADGRKMFGLWNICTLEAVVEETAPPNCTAYPALQVVAVSLGLCRCAVSLAVVGAIFGLELLVISRVSDGQDSHKRWSLGSALLLVAAALSAVGVVVFVALLWQHITPFGFTLPFWCQFTAVFLLFLNGASARHIHHMVEQTMPPGGHMGKI
ncbi:hypothetical protein UPYG_G00308100 [Umbra pygmaea]|uniref:Transmembrane protein 37 n=1 Tax=Umbra pygmaea TaxID=75934 RepID=A0ABD0W0S4_UMBPY